MWRVWIQSEDWAGRGTPSGGRRAQPTQDNWLEKKKKKKKQPIWMFTDYGNKSTHHCLAVRQLLFSAEAAAKGRKSHWTQPAQHGRAGRQTQPQAGEHNGAFSSLWCSYVPQDLLKTLNSAKREWKHDSKWMITLPCNCCEQGFLKI